MTTLSDSQTPAAELPWKQICFAGAGKVAGALGLAMYKAGLPVARIWSRRTENSEALARLLEAEAVGELPELAAAKDTLVIIAVRDDAIESVASRIASGATPVDLVHTSGSVDSAVLEPFATSYGSFYPLQTFSAEVEPDFGTIPFCLTGSDADLRDGLGRLALCLGAAKKNLFELSDGQRRRLHLAAVFTNNFANHCFTIAAELLAETGLPFDLLRPLIADTARNAIAANPLDVQTGPAVRGDEEVIARHWESLAAEPDLQEIYRRMTESIISRATSAHQAEGQDSETQG